MILANGQLERRASPMTSGGTRCIVGNELAVLEVPQRTRFFRASSPPAYSDHFIEGKPTRKRIVGGMHAYEASTAGNVVLERRLQFSRPTLIRSVVIEDDGLVFCKVRPELDEVATRRRRCDDVDLK